MTAIPAAILSTNIGFIFCTAPARGRNDKVDPWLFADAELECHIAAHRCTIGFEHDKLPIPCERHICGEVGRREYLFICIPFLILVGIDKGQ